MKTIHSLSPQLVSKIAAGEVVDRPASVIKELVENSIDAKATHIDITLTDGGSQKIVVKDNGIGMSKEDLLVSFIPHTTSKLLSEDDLFSIRSLGFRGEALSSIAAVSTLTIKSREQNTEHGHIIEVTDGKLIKEEAVGMPPGTEITVDSLFAFTPARKKFLKTSVLEIRTIAEMLTKFGLSHPEIGFTLCNDSKILLDLPGNQTHLDRINNLMSNHIATHMIPLGHENRYGTISGFIGKPQTAARSRIHDHIFVNSRVIQSSDISQIIIEAYGPLLEPRSYPPFVIFINLPFENVDVNVHPRKEEVEFIHLKEIKKLVEEAVKNALDAHDLTYRESTPLESRTMDTHMGDMLKDMITPWNLKNLEGHAILQIKNLYLVTMTDNGLLIVDQHAAHERILFEQFKEAFIDAGKEGASHELSEPKILSLATPEALTLEEHLTTFQKLGFELESFGKNTFKLSSVPLIFKERDHIKLITEVLNDIKEGRFDKIDRESERTLAFLACRTAIKAGESLAADERKKLIEKLLEAKTLYTCPHGRPTHIELPLSHLDKMFKRA